MKIWLNFWPNKLNLKLIMKNLLHELCELEIKLNQLKFLLLLPLLPRRRKLFHHQKKQSLFAQKMKLNQSSSISTEPAMKDIVVEHSSPLSTTTFEKSFIDGHSFPIVEKIEFNSINSINSSAMPRRLEKNKKQQQRQLLPVENWMQDIPENTPTTTNILRFDFNGFIIDNNTILPVSGGALFHHGAEESRQAILLVN
jgi:hypothetical protein